MPKFWVFAGLPLIFGTAFSVFLPSTADYGGLSSSFEHSMVSRCESTPLADSPNKNQLPADPNDKRLLRQSCVCFVKGANERLSWRQRGVFYSGTPLTDSVIVGIIQVELDRCAPPLVAYWAKP
ncbi:MAG: hypothetical protein H7340_20850 [Variovorax sp.]|nr:hypothetical protein [Variovorax sp.]